MTTKIFAPGFVFPTFAKCSVAAREGARSALNEIKGQIIRASGLGASGTSGVLLALDSAEEPLYRGNFEVAYGIVTEASQELLNVIDACKDKDGRKLLEITLKDIGSWMDLVEEDIECATRYWAERFAAHNESIIAKQALVLANSEAAAELAAYTKVENARARAEYLFKREDLKKAS